jgi:hypothetical protein
MFSLFYGLWNHVFSKTEFHVLILGVHKAGKTVILLCIVTVFSFCVLAAGTIRSSSFRIYLN